MAVWKGWRNEVVEYAFITRAAALAFYSGDPKTASRYIDKVFEVIDYLEAHPEMGATCKASEFRRFVVGAPAPGSPDILVYTYDKAVNEIIGEGVFSFLPAKYR